MAARFIRGSPDSLASRPSRFLSSSRFRHGSQPARLVPRLPRTSTRSRPLRAGSPLRAASTDAEPHPYASRLSGAGRAVGAPGLRTGKCAGPVRLVSCPPPVVGRAALGWERARVSVPPRQYPGWVRARVSVPPRQFPVWVRARVSVPTASVPRTVTCSWPARQSVHPAEATRPAIVNPRRPGPWPATVGLPRTAAPDRLLATRVRCAAARDEAGASTADREACLRPVPTPPPLGLR